uniref:FZ domain-containing protein n=1 Tax=Strigamia maritima TaxID=126957 RepID=T1J587_STRMM
MSNISTSSCKSSITSLSPQPFRSRLVVLNPEHTFKNVASCPHDFTCKKEKNVFYTGYVDSKERGTQMSKTAKTLSTNCCVVALIIILLLILCIVSGICFGFKMVESLLNKAEKGFKGLFHVTGEVYNSTFFDTSTSDYKAKATFYEKMINNLIEESVLKTAFIKSEVTAFDQKWNSTHDLIIYFNLYFNMKKAKLDSGHVYIVIEEQLQTEEKQFLTRKIKIVPNSLEISEINFDDINNSSFKTKTENPNPANISYPFTEPDPIFLQSDTSERKQCVPVGARFCNDVFYNHTSFPNIFGHKTRYEVDDFVDQHFSQLITSGCYNHLKHFLCSLLQPSCSQHQVIFPCQEFCHAFLTQCHSVFPFILSRFLHCNNYPSIKNTAEKCLAEPDCSTFLKSRNHRDWICDDINDCRDFSDENKCNRCKPGQFYCGGNLCIPIEKQCDNKQDCPNGLDEKHCITEKKIKNHQNRSLTNASFAHEIIEYRMFNFLGNFSKLDVWVCEDLQKINPKSTNQLSTISASTGVLVVRYQSIPAKVCVDNLNYTLLGNKKYVVLNEIARSTCEHLNYRKMKFVRIINDFHTSKFYYHISTDHLATTNTSLFLKTTCQTHQIISLGCSSFVLEIEIKIIA